MTTPPKLRNVRATLDNLAQAHPDDPGLAETRAWVSGLIEAEETRAGGREGFREFLRMDFERMLHKEGITSGKVCEIGGPYNSFAAELPDYDFTFLSLYPDDKFDNILVTDATQADHLPAEQFDAIYSTSVFEHISKPWLAAHGLSRLLKPGGVMYHAAPFSYFYHGAPADFWRYTPDAMRVIFSDLRPVKSEFFGRNRRRDNRGSEVNAVDRDGGPEFSVDAFGGWRENWFTIYVGVKDPAYLRRKMREAKVQTVVNLMKQLTKAGVAEEEAADLVHVRLLTVRVTRDQELYDCKEGRSNFGGFSAERILTLWKRRGREGSARPAYNRFAQARRVGLE